MGGNIIFVGMPGSGKSTLGRRLAKTHSMSFVDTDELIERRFGASLQQLLNRHGYLLLRELEQQVLCSLKLQNHVISTGGSAVYSAASMEHLASLGSIVYLHISVVTLLSRVNNSDARGLAKLPQQSLPSLYRERLPLYRRWANITIDNNRPMSAWQFEELVSQIEIGDQSRKFES